MSKLKLTYSAAHAASAAIAFIVVLTILAERSSGVKDWLAGFAGHHWTSKSILSVLLFALLTFLLYRFTKNVDGHAVKKAIQLSLWMTALGTFALLGFFTMHYFGLL